MQNPVLKFYLQPAAVARLRQGKCTTQFAAAVFEHTVALSEAKRVKFALTLDPGNRTGNLYSEDANIKNRDFRMEYLSIIDPIKICRRNPW